MSVSHIPNPRHVRWSAKHHIHASILSLMILSLALSVLWLGHWLPTSLPNKIEIREVTLTLPPPPPMQQQVVETQISLQVPGAGVAIPRIDVKQEIEPIKPDIPTVDIQQTEWQSLEVDWNAFDLKQLDGLPNLLTPLQVTFPKSLRRKGIKRVLVKLDVVIDEKGQVTLVNIIENPHPELMAEIQRLVRSSRFTAPKKDNESVRARFIWPINIKS